MSPNTTNATAEERLKDLGIRLPHPPAPLGAYVEAVQSGHLLFLSGTLPLEDGVPSFVGRIGAELSLEEGRRATHLAALNALAVARAHLGSLDRVSRVVRLAVSLVTTFEFHQHPKVADAAVFGAPNDDLGEEVKAVVQLMPNFRPCADITDELMAFCRANLAHHKCPRSIDFEAELPRLPTGKLYKGPLRERYWKGRESRIL